MSDFPSLITAMLNNTDAVNAPKYITVSGDGEGQWRIGQYEVKWNDIQPSFSAHVNGRTMLLTGTRVKARSRRSDLLSFSGVGLGYAFGEDDILCFELSTVEFYKLLFSSTLLLPKTMADALAVTLLCSASYIADGAQYAQSITKAAQSDGSSSTRPDVRQESQGE